MKKEMLSESWGDSLLSEMESLEIYGGSGNPKEWPTDSGCYSNPDCSSNVGCGENGSCHHNHGCVGNKDCTDLITTYNTCH